MAAGTAVPPPPLPPWPCLLPASLLGLKTHPLQRPWPVPPTQLFWEQELGCLGGRQVAKGLGAGGLEERASSSATLRRPPCSELRQLAPLVSPGHTDTVTWPWACLLKELPLSRPQVSGNQMRGGLTFFSLSFKATGAGQGQLYFPLRKGEGVYTHTQAKQTSPSLFF